MKTVQLFHTLNYSSPDCEYSLADQFLLLTIRVNYDMAVFWIYSLAEPNATIIAATFPVLRPLFRDVRARYYGVTERPSVAAYIKSTPSKQHTARGGSSRNRDSSSEQNILPRDGITRTREYVVSHEAEGSYQMDTSLIIEPPRAVAGRQ